MTLDVLLDAWPLLLLGLLLGALLMWLWMRRRPAMPAPIMETAISDRVELKAQIAQMEEEAGRKEASYQRYNKERNNLQQKLAQARKSRDNWRDRFKAKEEEVESLQGLLRRMEEERSRLRRSLDASQQKAQAVPAAQAKPPRPPRPEKMPPADPPQAEPSLPEPEAKPEPQEVPANASPADARKAETLARVSARASEVNFDRIGTATAGEKDDLKLIKGVGPFIEKKLNHLGIYTFRQIANFTPEDEEKVNEVIEFFPGRIRRDQWVAQCRERLNPQDGAAEAKD